MAIDINDTRTMLAALERSFPPTTLLRDTFFPNLQTFVTETVDIDYRKGGRQLSPFVTGDSSGVNVKRTGYDTKNYKPPMMMPKR
ncbi:MAG: major capsid protein, partial [Sporomusa sp.]